MSGRTAAVHAARSEAVGWWAWGRKRRRGRRDKWAGGPDVLINLSPPLTRGQETSFASSELSKPVPGRWRADAKYRVNPAENKNIMLIRKKTSWDGSLGGASGDALSVIFQVFSLLFKTISVG
jgi:hypothetical protein